MRKDDLVYVGHMLDTTRKAVEKVRGRTRESYDGDENLRLALAHLIQTIGEAARRVSPEFRERHSQVPWPAIVGMRHKVVHDYFAVDYDLIWDVVTVNLVQLETELARIVAETG